MSALRTFINRWHPWSIAVPGALVLTALFWAGFITLTGDKASIGAYAGSHPIKAMTEIVPRSPAPDVAFTDSNGTPVQLSDFAGSPLLVNLWATWCTPCVKEMPTLAALHEAIKDDPSLHLITISQDHQGAPVADAFMAENGWDALPRYHDPKGTLFRAFKARGLPTTYLIDAQGRVAAYLEGITDWAHPDMRDNIKAILDAGDAP